MNLTWNYKEWAILDQKPSIYYELSMHVFDSELNLPLENSKLQFALPKLDYDPNPILLDRLMDTMKQWQDANELKKQHNRGDTTTPLPSMFSLNKILQSEKTGTKTLSTSITEQKPVPYTLKKRSTSVTSSMSAEGAGTDSDTDMGDINGSELGSTTSSMYTMMDPYISNSRTTQQAPTLSKKKSSNASFFNSKPDLLMAPKVEGDHLGGTGNSTALLEINNKELGTDNLKLDYENNKRELLGLKMREYKALRSYRDTFTL